jgi:putative membrane protein
MLDHQTLEFEAGVVAAQVNPHSDDGASYRTAHNAGVFIVGLQPLALIAAVAAQLWYARALRRSVPAAVATGAAIGGDTSRSRQLGKAAVFTAGLLAVLVVTSSPVDRLTRTSFSAWLSQGLALMLLLPIPLLIARPAVQPTRQRWRSWADRPGPSALGRLIGSPIVGAGLVPVASVLVFFGPVPGWSIRWTPVGWLVQLALVAVGLVILTPVAGRDRRFSSMAMFAVVVIGILELVLDAIPGIVMRLSTHPVTTFFQYRVDARMSWLHDQQLAGGILWCVAELIDLPFLLLIFGRWVQADARDAAEVDAILDSVTATGSTPASSTQAGSVLTATADGPVQQPIQDEPWFLHDERLRDRFR